MGNLKTSKLRLLRYALLFFLAGCSAYQSVSRLHEPPRSALEIIRSDIWRTKKDTGIEITYRVIYKLTKIEEPTNVDILVILKSVSNEVLSQKKRTERRMSGLYPVSYSFNWKKKTLPTGTFVIEAHLETSFGRAENSKNFDFFSPLRPKPPESELKREIYSFLEPSKNPCSRNEVPVVKETQTASGISTDWFLECVRSSAPDSEMGELNITYPKSGRSYVISKSMYPEFYRKLNLNYDGKITLDEVGRVQQTLNAITEKYSKGDIVSIVREFLRAKLK